MDDESPKEKESEDEGEVGGSEDAIEAFGRKWNWIYMVDNVAHLTNCTFQQVYGFPVTEFLNYACYVQDKNNWEKANIDKIKNGRQ